MVTLRIELAKERDLSAALRKQVAELKSVLGQDLSKFKRSDLDSLLQFEVNDGNATDRQPSAEIDPSSRLPSLDEQVTILTNQNLNLMEELAECRVRADNLEKQLREHQPSRSESANGGGWTKMFSK